MIGRTIALEAAVPGVLELLFGMGQEKAVVVSCKTVAIFASLEDFLLRRSTGELFVAEERAKVFRCTTDQRRHWDLKTATEIMLLYGW